MRFISMQFISFACMFAMTAQAASDNRGTPTSVAESHSSDAAGVEYSDGNPGVKEVVLRGGSRYGIGFEARQGIGSDAQGNRGGRDERAKRGSQGR
ncbi:MAG: hypothetical protein LT080_00335 [Thiobacillus sp.]|nr:hypothetical protein [Thiobacillus sp.]